MTSRTLDPHNPEHPGFRLGCEASDWLVRLQDPRPEPDDPYFDPEKRSAAFLEWLQRSPEHVRMFLETRETYQRLGQIDPASRLRIDELLEKTSAEVIQLFGFGEPAPRPKRARRAIVAIAATVATVAIAGLFAWKMFGVREYVTAIGQQSTFKLEDGSFIYLNTDSRVRVDLSTRHRHVELLRGEALFVVEHDPVRPFTVSTGRTNIRAVGTQFNVRRRDESTEVTVVEGVVQVTAPVTTPEEPRAVQSDSQNHQTPDSLPASATHEARLDEEFVRAGEGVKVAGGRLSSAVHPNVAETLSWRERRLAFQNTPLSEVAAEFNRYNVAQIRVEGPVNMELTGVFDADRPNALILYATKQAALVVSRDGSNWIIRAR